ncbi:hypothetical protein UC8_48030 [Roseimaritima ulvae]|uniref:Carboxypeptidase regulatory-like domain-containing protein n=2 Tax=Roseimaritima ulvae TaxID=980254 RepID=A0A5B9R7R2_9BACT|nr:hypothetical protein UC8_48030 [Roseimaritima ulvae]
MFVRKCVEMKAGVTAEAGAHAASRTFLSLGLSALVAVMVLGTSGCGGGDRPPIGEVEGTVTLDGQPVADAQIFFEPTGGGRSSSAITDADGTYELSYMGDVKGAVVGEHLVRISTAKGATRDDNGRVTDPGQPEQFPSSYNSESTQKVTVEGGDNEINFDATSDK